MKKLLTTVTLMIFVSLSALAAPTERWFQNALSGNRIAQRHIAESFENGTNGFSQNLIIARRWYAIAAKNGDKASARALERIDGQLSAEQLAFAQSNARINGAALGGGAFSDEFLEDMNNGDLDGYLLIGSCESGAVDGAYLPRLYDKTDKANADVKLPLRCK